MLYFRPRAFCFTIAILILPAGGFLSAEDRADESEVEPIRIGCYRQLFLDDYLIDSMHAIRRNVHAAENRIWR